MELAKFENILAIKTGSGKLIGFHARNMQVASLEEGVWNALREPTLVSEERTEIEQWNREVDANARDLDIEQKPRSLLVNIAQICNLKCNYCAAGGDGTFGEAMKHVDLEIIFDQIRMIVHDLGDGEEFHLTFFGGEPLLAPDTIRSLARFVKLQAAGRGIRVRFSVITNGTLVTPESAELLAGINCHVTVSIDGPPEINDRTRKTRGGRGSSAQTLKGLEVLQTVRARLGSLSVGAVFGKHHTGVLETYKFLRDFDFDTIRFDFAADANDTEASRAYAEELAKTADFAFANGGERELRKMHQFDGYFQALDEQRRMNNHCGAGKSLFAIDGKGRVSACQWFIGRPAEEVGRGTELKAEQLAKYAGRLNELNSCQSCWARHLCGGGCMYVNELKTGSKHKKDAEFCERTRNTIAKAIEFYAEARNEGPEGERSETH